jgi:ribosomal peptide maturation radical SAM protein 1
MIWLGSMPWTNVDQPSLGLSILKAVLEEAGIESRIEHLNIEFLQFLSSNTYAILAQTFGLNDFLFTYCFEAEISNKQFRLLRIIAREMLHGKKFLSPRLQSEEDIVENIVKLRNETIPKWLNETADRLIKEEYLFYGFTCMFDQTIASVALAKKIKERKNSAIIVLGGYSLKEPTGTAILNSFECIDCLCSREGEAVIVQLASALESGKSLSSVDGLLVRTQDGTIVDTGPIEKWHLDDVPDPNFEDYMHDLEHLRDSHCVELTWDTIPVENSRGCWWGQKNHCVFCGIDEESLSYRYKTPERVLSSLNNLAEKYNKDSFRFSDYILPNQYYGTLLPKLAGGQRKFEFGGEIKANVSASKMRLLKESGFQDLQPGIETFSSEILRTMNKGVTSTKCIHLLRMGKEYGIRIYYNILYGFPNEMANPYKKMEKAIQNLTHLDPPLTCGPVQITKDAPLQADPESFGIKKATYHEAYDLIFSDSFRKSIAFNLNDFAYYFERNFSSEPELEKLYRKIDKHVANWHIRYVKNKPSLSVYRKGDIFVVEDNRCSPKTYELTKLQSLALSWMSEPQRLTTIRRKLEANHSSIDIDEALQKLNDLGLLFEDEEIGVALPTNIVSFSSVAIPVVELQN